VEKFAMQIFDLEIGSGFTGSEQIDFHLFSKNSTTSINWESFLPAFRGQKVVNSEALST
jgi:hypothetical protein